MGGGWGGLGEEVRGLRRTNRYLQYSYGDVVYGVINGLVLQQDRSGQRLMENKGPQFGQGTPDLVELAPPPQKGGSYVSAG